MGGSSPVAKAFLLVALTFAAGCTSVSVSIPATQSPEPTVARSPSLVITPNPTSLAYIVGVPDDTPLDATVHDCPTALCTPGADAHITLSKNDVQVYSCICSAENPPGWDNEYVLGDHTIATGTYLVEISYNGAVVASTTFTVTP